MNIVYNTLAEHPIIEEYNLHKLNNRGCYYIYGFDKTQKYSGKVEDYCNQKTQKDRTGCSSNGKRPDFKFFNAR